MVVIITPAIDGLKREWGEAAATLGATQYQYWRMVVIPVIWPSFLGTVILLFANAFGADRFLAQYRADPALCADSRRRAP